MLGFAILGVGVLAYGGVRFSARHSKALLDAAFLLPAGRIEKVEKQLELAVALPPFPWEKNRHALCLNLLAYVKAKLGKAQAARELCRQLLELAGIAEVVKGLSYLRLEETCNPHESASFRAQSEELWMSGRDSLEKLNLWEQLAHLFYATGCFERAAECYERALKRNWTDPNLYLRSRAYQHLPEAGDRFEEKTREALKYVSPVTYKIDLLNFLSIHLHRKRRLQEAREFAAECLSLLNKYSYLPNAQTIRENLLILSIHQLRGLQKYEEAEELREQLSKELGRQDLVKILGLLHEEGEFQECQALLDQHGQADNPGVLYAWGVTSFEMGHPAPAVEKLAPVAEDSSLRIFLPSPFFFLVSSGFSLLDRNTILHYLDKLGEREEDARRSFALRLAYEWDGAPDQAARLDPAEVDPIHDFYRGSFESLLTKIEAHTASRHQTSTRDFLQANLHFYRAAVLHWAERHEEARNDYERAEPLFRGSPFKRAECRVHFLECEAFLGSSEAAAEFSKIRESYLVRYADNYEFMFRLEQTQITLDLLRGDFPNVISRATTYLTKEPRKLLKANVLRNRAKAHLGAGSPGPAGDDCKTIIDYVPRSFLAAWAQTTLDAL